MIILFLARRLYFSGFCTIGRILLKGSPWSTNIRSKQPVTVNIYSVLLCHRRSKRHYLFESRITSWNVVWRRSNMMLVTLNRCIWKPEYIHNSRIIHISASPGSFGVVWFVPSEPTNNTRDLKHYNNCSNRVLCQTFFTFYFMIICIK